jgi:hypothetical protein
MLACGTRAGEAEVVAEKLSPLAQLPWRHGRLRQQIRAQQASVRAATASVFTRAAAIAVVWRGCARWSSIPSASSRSASHSQPKAASSATLASPLSCAKMAQSAFGSFVTRRDTSSSPASSKAATCEVLRWRSMPTSTMASLLSDPELATSA